MLIKTSISFLCLNLLCALPYKDIEADCIKYKVKIPVDQTFKESIDWYTEGVFYEFIFPDTSGVYIHYGSNVKRPFHGNVTEGDTIQIDNLDVVKYQGIDDETHYIEYYYLESEISIVALYYSKLAYAPKTMGKAIILEK